MTATLALAGDTMLGRGVADVLRGDPHVPLVSPEVAEHLKRADCLVLNLECCISDRGAPFPDPDKPFFFRAPPLAAERLAELGVDAVTLANNHALDYGADALLDTLSLLKAAGVGTVGAGQHEEAARTPYRLPCGELILRLVALCDHPAAFAARAARPVQNTTRRHSCSLTIRRKKAAFMMSYSLAEPNQQQGDGLVPHPDSAADLVGTEPRSKFCRK
jgi:poly-gamma-glutamate synthesis protein (capsule biosynthesis protein)